MDPIAAAALAAWSMPLEVVVPAGVAAVIYLRGFASVRRQLPARFPPWRRTAFLGGLAALLAALASPVDAFADLSLQIHMLQHWLLMIVAPPLLWLGQPVVPLLRGLPQPWLERGLGPLLSWPALRRLLATVTRPAVALPIFAATTLVWHWPVAYDAALRSRDWHDLEHATFLAAALAFWHPVVAPWPGRAPADRLGIVVYLGVAAVFNTVFSAAFAFSTQPFYAAYADAPRAFGVDPLTDQNLAGALLWVGASVPMVVAAVATALSSVRATSLARPHPAPPPPRARAARERARALLGARRTRKTAQVVLALLAAAIVADGLLGPQRPSASNLAGVLPWTYWRGLAVIGLLVAGNVFCAVCPFTLTRPLSRRLGGSRRWPRALRNKWLACGLFALYLWTYEVFALWDSPWWTAWLVVGYFAACFAVEGLFGRGVFCKHVCPIGQFHFVASGVSPTEVRALDARVCAACSTHDCVRGGPRGPGCPTDLFLPRKEGGLDCTSCLDCVRACPHGNAALLPVTPAASLGGSRAARLDVGALALVFSIGAFVNAAAMVAPVDAVPGMPVWLAAALVAAPLAAALACASIGRAAAGATAPVARIAAALAPALVPIGFAMWLAHFGFHALTGWRSAAPAVARAASDVGLTLRLEADPPGVPAGALAGLEIALLGVGLVVTIAVLWRLARGLAPGDRRAAALAAPWAALALALYAAGVWIFQQPMQMRGMPM